jgi:hypothetical protein
MPTCCCTPLRAKPNLTSPHRRLISENAKAAPDKDTYPRWRPCDFVVYDTFITLPVRPKGGLIPWPRLRPGCPVAAPPTLGRWERQSRPLAVTGADARGALKEVLRFLKGEEAALKDDTLGQEVDLLQKLVDLKS